MRWRPVLLRLPPPFHPEDTTGPGAVRGEYRRPLPPAWQVELRAIRHSEPNYSSANTYDVLLSMFGGRVLARVPGWVEGHGHGPAGAPN